MKMMELDTSSSDSSDTVIISKDDTPKAETELDELFKKYLSEDYCPKTLDVPDDVSIVISDSPEDFGDPCSSSEFKASSSKYIPLDVDDLDDLPDFSCSKKPKKDIHSEVIDFGDPCSSTEVKASSLKNIPLEDVDDLDYLPDFSCSKKPKKDISPRDFTRRSSSKEEREILKQQKLREKELKKEEERKAKALKEALASHYKNLKPENCLKFIKVHIDQDVIKKDYSEEILGELRNKAISFNIESQTNSTISWTRQIDTHILDLNGQLIDTSKGLNIEEVLLIIECNDFVNHVHNNRLSAFIQSKETVLKGKKIILAIYGLEKYYKHRRAKKTQEINEEISGKTYRKNKEFGDLPVVSRRKVEYALTEIQLFNSISHRMVETARDLAQFVFQLTKSIAQVPYKLEKQEKMMQSKWFMSEDNKNCIRVDKNGNGLSRLWKQMITTFPLASLETAEAIAAVYPTPLKLMQAYDKIPSEIEGEKLLQDIPIRRTAGPISTMRKVGPELSKKFYHLFTSIDPNKVL